MTEVQLITLDPGHFHAALVQKEMYPGVAPRVHVYAPLGADLMAHLNRIAGFRCQSPEGAFYAWVNIEDTGLPAEQVASLLLEEVGVAGIAGAAFGAEGKNYLRFSLVGARHLLEEALERIERVSVRWRAAVAR